MSDQRKTHPGDTIKETLKLVFATDPQSVCVRVQGLKTALEMNCVLLSTPGDVTEASPCVRAVCT